jgi:hypothetical protein
VQTILIRSGKDPWEYISPVDMLWRNSLGTNQGNLLFSESVHRTLTRSDAEVVSNHWAAEPERAAALNERYDAFVVPLANAFRLDFSDYLARLTSLIRRLDIPVVVVGVGAQASPGYEAESLAPIDDVVREFAAAVLDRSATIGVRGEFTADYLARLGFTDVDVIGCPSMFLHGPELPVGTGATSLDERSRLAVNVTPGLDVVRRVVEANASRYADLFYVPQHNDDLDALLYGPSAEGRTPWMALEPTHPLVAEGRVRFFLDPRTWLEGLRDRDFVLGSRLHGCIAGLLAGVPSMLLTHDSRTVELARYHHLPSLPVAELRPDTDASELFERTDLDGLRRSQRQRFDTYLAFLERNGLAHAYEPGQSTEGLRPPGGGRPAGRPRPPRAARPAAAGAAPAGPRPPAP